LFVLISSPDDTERLFEIAMLLMEDDGDLGMYMSVSIPISLHVSNMTKFIELMLQKVSDGKKSQVFIRNAMEILRGLADQKYWTSPMINVNTFAPLVGQLVDSTRAVRGKQAFIPTTTEGTNYVIEITNAKSLYEGVMGMIKRNKTLDSLTSRVQIDTLTLQRLMLNLAFINMVNGRVDPIVRKSALDLVSAVFASFNFAHETQVSKVPIEMLPENLLGFVVSLSQDSAKHNSECYSGFISEFFKAYCCIEQRCKPVTFHFLKPWIRPWASNINEHPGFIGTFPAAHKEMLVELLSLFVTEPRILHLLNERILKANGGDLVRLVTILAGLNACAVTAFWVNEGLSESKTDTVVFCATAIAALLSSHSFDYNANVVTFIYKVSLAAVLAETAGVDGGNVYNVPQLMLPMFLPEMEPVRMTGDQLDFMLGSLFA
jgi:hypothetical protein